MLSHRNKINNSNKTLNGRAPSLTKRGFSLVELSIVLVILGLLVGGILGGQSLIHAAELRTIPASFNQYQTAAMTFKDKYFSIPGDMTNATAFWGAEPVANCPGTSATPSTTTATCNGGGDGKISTSGGVNVGNELFRYWQHLANAGLIEGSYNGVQGPLGADHTIRGVNSPVLKMGSTTVKIQYFGIRDASLDDFNGDYGNAYQYGIEDTISGSTQTPFLTPQDAWNIDKKMDDGRPGLGTVRSRTNLITPGCVDSDVDTVAQYQLSNTSIVCQMVILSGS